MYSCYCFFIRQKTAYDVRISGWRSDVCSSDLSADTYQQVRLILAPNVDGAATLNNSVVPSCQTTEVALKTPSAVQTGIKVNTRAPYTVDPGTIVDLVLDFNAC